MRLGFLFLLLSWSSWTWSAADADIYEVGRLVATQSVAERNAAVREGLGEVLVRVSGRAQTLSNPGVQAALVNAERALLEYSYAPSTETLEHIDPQDGSIKQLPAERLLMRFSASLVRDLLRNNAEPILPHSVPLVLAWVAVDDGRTELLGAESRPELVALLREEAVRRGVGLLLPLLDIDDSLLVDGHTVWDYDIDTLREASQRYGAEDLLVARLFVSSGGEWVGDWRFEFDVSAVNGDGRGTSARDLLGPMVDQLAEMQSLRFAVFADRDDTMGLSVKVEGVDDFEQYMALSRYFAGLTAVREAIVSRIDGETAEFNVYIDTSVATLEQEIALGNVLVPLSSGSEGQLRFRMIEN